MLKKGSVLNLLLKRGKKGNPFQMDLELSASLPNN